MKKRIISILITIVVIMGMVPFGVFSASAAEDNTVKISTVEQWNEFADSVANGNTYNGIKVELTADIGTEENPVTEMAGCINYGKIVFSGDVTPQKKTYTVTFEGTSIKPIEVEPGTYLSRPMIFEENGKFLFDWYSDANYENKWDFRNNYITEDTVLYALWLSKEEIFKADIFGFS